MTKQGLLVLLCAALVGCDANDPNTAAESANIVVPQSVVSFSASSGSGVVLRVVDTANTTAIPSLTVRDPSGAQVASGSGGDVAAAAFRAATAGTFTVTITDISSQQPSGVIFTLYLAVAPGANTGGLLSPGSVTFGHLDEGELDSYTFTAAAGEGVILRVTDLKGGSLIPGFTIYGPTGAVVQSVSAGDVASWMFAAPTTGTYTAVIYDASSSHAFTGDYNLYYFKAPRTSTGGALTPGRVVSGHIDEGELDSYTFTAVAGEGVILRVTDIAGVSFIPGFTIYRANGAVVQSVSAGAVASWMFAAPATETYTVVVYDASSGHAFTGDYNLYYFKAPGTSTGGALIPGSVVLGQIDEGELDSYTFTAAAGEGITLSVTDVAGVSFIPGFTIYRANGAIVQSVSGGDVARWTFSAPAPETYTVAVYDASSGHAFTGEYQVALTSDRN